MLFGYDTYVHLWSFHSGPLLIIALYCSGVAGSVVAQSAFQKYFIADETGTVNKADVTNVSSNVVSVLQAGAFFGALGSAPVSGI